jgi:hypothetical protein
MIIRVGRGQFGGFSQMLSRFRAVADAAEGGGIAVEQANGSFRPRIIKLGVQLNGLQKFLFHLAYQLKGAQHPRAGQLALVHAKIIVSWG